MNGHTHTVCFHLSLTHTQTPVSVVHPRLCSSILFSSYTRCQPIWDNNRLNQHINTHAVGKRDGEKTRRSNTNRLLCRQLLCYAAFTTFPFDQQVMSIKYSGGIKGWVSWCFIFSQQIPCKDRNQQHPDPSARVAKTSAALKLLLLLFFSKNLLHEGLDNAAKK